MARPVNQLGVNFRGLRAIVVEDNKVNQKIIRRIMSHMGCEKVEAALNGDDALTVMLSASHGFDIIISDYEMPVMNGLQLLKEIRVGSRGISRDIPFVMLTGHSDRFIVGTAFSLDVDSFVVKPVTPNALKARIGHIMSADRLIKQPADYEAISINPNEIQATKTSEREQFVKPPWEIDEAHLERTAMDRAVERDLSLVKPGSTLAKTLYSSSGHLLLHEGQVLDKRTIERLGNLSELDASVRRLIVNEAREQV